jgi:hypothetical protein
MSVAWRLKESREGSDGHGDGTARDGEVGQGLGSALYAARLTPLPTPNFLAQNRWLLVALSCAPSLRSERLYWHL